MEDGSPSATKITKCAVWTGSFLQTKRTVLRIQEPTQCMSPLKYMNVFNIPAFWALVLTVLLAIG